jgi:hypothetical protein
VARQACRVVLVGVALVSGTARDASAAGWADGLFSEQGHDFGPVARGAKVHHPFVLTNRLEEPVTILNLRASCGCTTGKPSQTTIPPGQRAVIEAEMDTRNFTGKKATTLFVTLVTAGGQEAEVRLAISSTILSDIVLNPGTIDFGSVTKGQATQKVLTIDRVGAPQWRVERMLSACRAIDASMVETARNSSTVSYALTVTLKPDAPAGVLRDEIRVVTNDPESPGIPIQVTGLIRGDLTATPSLLSLGRVSSTDGIRGKLLVRSSKPFRIVSVEGAGDGFTVTADDSAATPLHLLTVGYRPEEGTNRGDLRKTFRVLTDLPSEPPLEVTATLHVDP